MDTHFFGTIPAGFVHEQTFSHAVYVHTFSICVGCVVYIQDGKKNGKLLFCGPAQGKTIEVRGDDPSDRPRPPLW